jgi:hypothetical protein
VLVLTLSLSVSSFAHALGEKEATLVEAGVLGLEEKDATLEAEVDRDKSL